MNLAGGIFSETADRLEITSSSDELASDLSPPKSNEWANLPSRGDSKSAVEFKADVLSWSSSEIYDCVLKLFYL